MVQQSLSIENIPAILYGEKSDSCYLFVHGKHACKEDAYSFASTVTGLGYQVLSFDLPEHGERRNSSYICSPGNALHDLSILYKWLENHYSSLSLYACSLGAYFSLLAFNNVLFNRTLFVSPLLDMEHLIENMLGWAGISEKELEEKREIATDFGETLSWEYLQFVRQHPVCCWPSSTFILYGEHDTITERRVLDSFVKKFDCTVDIMAGGEHFFHTAEQLGYLDQWVRKVTKIL